MKTKILLIALILVAQVVGLFCVSFARERERANNPTFRLECRSYDPRDILRGHYLPLYFKIEDGIPFSKMDAESQTIIRKELLVEAEERLKKNWMWFINFSGRKIWIVLAPNAETGIWEVEYATLNDPKINFCAETPNKIALPATTDDCLLDREIKGQTVKDAEEFFTQGSPFETTVRLNWRDTFPNRRFYLSEGKAKAFDTKLRGNSDHVFSVELYLNAAGTPVPKRLFIDGVEF